MYGNMTSRPVSSNRRIGPVQSTMQKGTSYQHGQQANLYQKTLEKLGRSMGYDLTRFHIRDRKLVLADAITTLEKLRLGRQITKRPRGLEEHKVLTILRQLISASHIADVALRDDTTEDEISEAELVAVMLAASNSIDDFKGRGEEFIQKSTAVTGARALCKQLINGSDVGFALQKMEEWCDAWLAGDLKDEDWETFENCLDR